MDKETSSFSVLSVLDNFQESENALTIDLQAWSHLRLSQAKMEPNHISYRIPQTLTQKDNNKKKQQHTFGQLQIVHKGWIRKG